MRRKAKAINFGIIYGISQYGLAKQINVSNNEAADFFECLLLRFPEIKDYISSTIKFCRKSGYVSNIFGRRTHITGINDKNFNVKFSGKSSYKCSNSRISIRNNEACYDKN